MGSRNRRPRRRAQHRIRNRQRTIHTDWTPVVLNSITNFGRRLVRFRLRTLFVLTTVTAIALGVWVRWVAQAQRQAEAVKALWPHATVYYDYMRVGDEWKRDAPQPGPAWLRERMG